MCVQDPPVTLTWLPPADGAFDHDLYRAYTRNGSHIEYVVWPVLYLHEGGSIITKGVAQGIDK